MHCPNRKIEMFDLLLVRRMSFPRRSLLTALSCTPRPHQRACKWKKECYVGVEKETTGSNVGGSLS